MVVNEMWSLNAGGCLSRYINNRIIVLRSCFLNVCVGFATN